MSETKKLDGLKKRNDVNLAEGEVTGHAHRCFGEGVAVYDEPSTGIRVLDAPNGCDLTHEEHNTLKIAPGQWDAHRVYERDHAEEEARQVAD